MLISWFHLAPGAARPYIGCMPPPSSPTLDPPSRGLCPICRKGAVAQFHPFCSRRCADVDLNRWLSGVYAVPAVEGEDEEPGAEPQGSQRER